MYVGRNGSIDIVYLVQWRSKNKPKDPENASGQNTAKYQRMSTPIDDEDE